MGLREYSRRSRVNLFKYIDVMKKDELDEYPPSMNSDAFPESKDCEKIARFMGWTGSEKKVVTTDMNLFCEAWNKAVDAYLPEIKKRVALRERPWIYQNEKDIWDFLCKPLRTITIAEFQPTLIKIIDFLSQETK